jgi:hypothetical protein
MRHHEAVIGLTVAAASVWIVLVTTFLPRQPIPGGDFMQFYTMGATVLAGDWALQYDWPALHELQIRLVPGSEDYTYGPAYPPLVAAFYAPFSTLPFRAAYAAWAIAASAAYALMIWLAARACEYLPRRAALPAALLFPPFIALILTGQTTLLPLAGFVLGWFALERDRPALAGAALALVALKPNFGIALAFVLVLSASWRVVLGVAAGSVGLAATTWLLGGGDAIAAWWTTTMRLAADPAVVEPVDARHTHALRMTLEAVVSPHTALVIWLVVGAGAIALAVRSWRSAGSPALRVAALLFATVIVSPHVLAYDAVLLAPACVWLADRGLRLGRPGIVWGVLLLAVLFVVPYGRVLGVPLTVPLGLWLISRCR